MNSKLVLETFVKRAFIVETIRGMVQSEGWLQGTSVIGSVYWKKAALGQQRSRRFLTFIGGPLNVFKVRDRRNGVLLKEHGLEMRGDTH